MRQGMEAFCQQPLEQTILEAESPAPVKPSGGSEAS